MAESKIFKHQSGVIKAVGDDLKEVLEATMVMVGKVENPQVQEEPSPPIDPGLYSLSGLDHPEFTEIVDLSGILPSKTFPKK